MRNALLTSTWYSSQEGLGKDIKMLWCIYTYKGQNYARYSICFDTFWKWKLDFKEAAWDWWLWTLVLENFPENTLGSQENKLMDNLSNQPRVFTQGTNDQSQIILKIQSLEKIPMLGKVEGKKGQNDKHKVDGLQWQWVHREMWKNSWGIDHHGIVFLPIWSLRVDTKFNLAPQDWFRWPCYSFSPTAAAGGNGLR